MDVDTPNSSGKEAKVWYSQVAHTAFLENGQVIEDNMFKQIRMFSVNAEDNDMAASKNDFVTFVESQHKDLNDKIGAVSESLEKQLRYGRDAKGRQFTHLYATFSTSGYTEHSWPANFEAGKSEMVCVRAQETGMFYCLT